MWNVYLMSASDGDETIWKIGVSKHPEKRFKEHKVSNPKLQKINALFECEESRLAYMIESMLISYLKDFKIDGEWFDGYSLTPELFILYCERFYKNAKVHFEIEENIKNSSKI